MNFLLDTNVISEARKPQGDSLVKGWFSNVSEYQLFISVLTIGEIGQGIGRLQLRDPSQAARLDRWLATIRASYTDRLLPVTLAIADRWATLNVPNRLPPIDGLLAATALEHDLVLATRNTRDFATTEARLFNPFEDTAP